MISFDFLLEDLITFFDLFVQPSSRLFLFAQSVPRLKSFIAISSNQLFLSSLIAKTETNIF